MIIILVVSELSKKSSFKTIEKQLYCILNTYKTKFVWIIEIGFFIKMIRKAYVQDSYIYLCEFTIFKYIKLYM